MVGAGRFELPTSCTPSKRASQATLHPEPLERGQYQRKHPQFNARFAIRRLFFYAECPFDAAKDVGLILFGDFNRVFTVGQVGVGVPEVFAMAKGGVKDPAVTVTFAPGDGIMAGVAGFRMFIEDEEIVNF